MRRWIGWASRLYPAAWRRRYSREFDALLDDSPLRWRDLADVLRGALIMQVTSWRTYGKAAAVAGIAGAIVAAAVSFALPNRYASQAIMRFLPAPGADLRQIQERLQRMDMEIFSPEALQALIQDPSLDLYHNERQNAPLAEIVERMRTHDIRVMLYTPRGARAGNPAAQAFVIDFRYPDRNKAQMVVRHLVSRFIETHLRMALVNANLSAPPAEMQLDLLEAPTLPATPIFPNHVTITLAGLLAGLALGLLGTLVWRRWPWPRVRT